MDEIRTTENDELRQYLTVPWRRRWLILAVTVLAAVGTYLYYSSQPKQYTAGTAIFVQSSPVDALLFGDTGGDPQRNTQNLADLLATRAVATESARRLHYTGDITALLQAVRVSAA